MGRKESNQTNKHIIIHVQNTMINTHASIIHIRHIKPSLVLAQPRKTHPFITEILLVGPNELNQTNKQITHISKSANFSRCWLTLFILNTGKQVLWQTVKTQTVAFHQFLHCLLR